MSAVVRHDPELPAPMLPEDLDEVVAIERRVYPFPWTRGNFADALRAGYTAWALRADGGRMIAYSVTMLALDEAHLLNLSVDAPFQRAGVGWKMLEWVARVTRDYGALSLLLEVRPSNAGAMRLYRRYGFEPIGRRRNYYPAVEGREDAIVMRVAL